MAIGKRWKQRPPQGTTKWIYIDNSSSNAKRSKLGKPINNTESIRKMTQEMRNSRNAHNAKVDTADIIRQKNSWRRKGIKTKLDQK